MLGKGLQLKATTLLVLSQLLVSLVSRGTTCPLPFSRGRSTHYSDRLHDFSVTIPRRYKDVYVNNFFSHTARLWNSLLIECFPIILMASCLE